MAEWSKAADCKPVTAFTLATNKVIAQIHKKYEIYVMFEFLIAT